MTSASAARGGRVERGFMVELGRAAGGAVIFSLPVMMTMEMWELGAGMDRIRLLALFAGITPLLVGLSHYVGFETTKSWVDDLRDAFVAIAVGFLASAVVLSLFGVLHPGLSVDEMTGALVIQTVPASFGAIIAKGQFGQPDDDADGRARSGGYPAELLFMASGAVFLSFNVAPTEEIQLITASMTPFHGLALAAATIAIMHAVVYGVRFVGQNARRPSEQSASGLFLRYTIVGYAVALLVSAAMLWIFGTLEQLGATATVRHVVTLAFPAAIGAAFARILVGGGNE